MEQHTTFETAQKRALLQERIRRGAVYLLLTLWALIVLFPFLVVQM